MKRFVILAGGTGGHIFPALSLTQCLQKKGHTVLWIGTPESMEAKMIPQQSIPFIALPMKRFRGKSWMHLLSAPFFLCMAILRCLSQLKKIKPDAVIGFGGFVSAPGGCAAVLLRIPLFIHEQNAVMGMANRYLSYFAKAVLTGFADVTNKTRKTIFVGNPLRAEFENILDPMIRFKNELFKPLRILILGGSQGAQFINDLLPEVLNRLHAIVPIEVIHQTGTPQLEYCQQKYAHAPFSCEVKSFIENMVNVYQWAHLVIARAGALTLAEITATGLPSILIPYPYAVDDHQTQNAATLVHAGAAICLAQNNLTADILLDTLISLIHAERLQAMARASYPLKKLNVAEAIVDFIVKEIV